MKFLARITGIVAAAAVLAAFADLCDAQEEEGGGDEPEKKSATLPWTADSSHYDDPNGFFRPSYDAYLKRIREARERKGGSNLALIGDGFLEGWDRYPEHVKKYFSPYTPLNLSVEGDMTQHVLYRLESPDLAKFKIEIAVLMVGANNNLSKVGDAVKGIMAVADKVKERWAGVTLIFVSLPPGAAGTDAVNSILKKNADGKNTFYLDMNEAMKAAGGFGKFTKDGVHFNDDGYQLLGENLSKTLAQVKSQNMFKRMGKPAAAAPPAKKKQK